VLVRSVASPSVINHRKDALYSLADVRYRMALDPNTPRAARAAWRNRAAAAARELLAYRALPPDHARYMGQVLASSGAAVVALELVETALAQSPQHIDLRIERLTIELRLGVASADAHMAELSAPGLAATTARRALARLLSVGHHCYSTHDFPAAARLYFAAAKLWGRHTFPADFARLD
jgi:hypothetical protein